MLILFADIADTDGFVGRLNFSPANDHIKRNCAKVTSKKSKLSRVGGRGRFRGREGLSWAASAALRETSSRPRATLFFSAGFFSLEKKRVHSAGALPILHAHLGGLCASTCTPARGISVNDAKQKTFHITKIPAPNGTGIIEFFSFTLSFRSDRPR